MQETSSAALADIVHRAAGLLAQRQNAEAEILLRDALARWPDRPELLEVLGTAHEQGGDPVGAEAFYRAALARAPRDVTVATRIGHVLHNQRRFPEAMVAFQTALAINPDYVDALHGLAVSLHSAGDLNAALAAFDHAITLSPGHAGMLTNRGIALDSLGRPEDALESFARALAIDPEHEDALHHTLRILFERHRIAEGLALFATHAARTPKSGPKEEAAHKKRHDDEQRAYLKERGGEMPVIDGPLYLTADERLSGPAINSATGVEAVSKEWRQGQPPIVVIDDFLTDEALAQLREFCWGSNIWRRSYEGGYLGAMPEHGFAVPLLAQIAEELRVTYPDIFKAHALHYLWAFKYDSGLSGIGIHADEAAVNVNFWITPDEANLDPQSGGLIVWDVSAPLDWEFERFNCDKAAIRDFLAREGAKPVVIPYRANRAVIFASDLFHETDKIFFKDGYKNRRINITLLYGQRNA